ncbi:MAG TPA: hypothetical protein VLQ67_13595 [Arachnia sp.]|nr:hypothetical protein [Arachnia sp.]
MSQAAGPPESRESTTRALVLGGAVVALYLSLGAIDRLIGRVDGEAPASMAAASGLHAPIPLPTSDSQPWLALFTLGDSAAPLVWTFTAVDCTMAVLYGLLLSGLLAKLRAGQGRRPPTLLRLFTTPRPWVAWAAAAADLVENVLLLAIFLTGRAGEQMSARLVLATAVVSLIKWGALLLAVLPLASVALAWGWRRLGRRGG